MSRIRLVIGVAISLVLLFFTFRGLDWGEVGEALRGANFVYIALAAVVIVAAFGVRAVRWSYLLRPVRLLPARNLFSVVLIGFFGNYVLPAKTGELVRAYVLGRRENLSKSAILGSIAVEKTMDTLILFGIWLTPNNPNTKTLRYSNVPNRPGAEGTKLDILVTATIMT